jgi:CrcB protein
MSPALWIGVAALGGIGAIARFAVDGVVSSRSDLGGFPLGTLVVNLSGAFLLGLLVGIGLKGHGYLLAGTAVLGSYTTFSTWMLESQRLGEDGQSRLLVLNLAISLFAGLAAAELGRLLGGVL